MTREVRLLVMLVVAAVGVIVIVHVYQATQRVNNAPSAPADNVCTYTGGQVVTLPNGTACPAFLP